MVLPKKLTQIFPWNYSQLYWSHSSDYSHSNIVTPSLFDVLKAEPRKEFNKEGVTKTPD